MADVEIIDRGWNAAMRAFAEMDGAEAKAGIIDDEETARYGIVWEGRAGWLRDTTDRNMRNIDRGLVRLQNDLVAGASGEDTVGEIAGALATEMQDALRAEGLEESGALIDSVTSEVEF
jgi:hypothetical protein